MGAILPENYANLKYDNFAFVFQDKESIEALGRTKRRVKVHLECNTGMNRYGADPSELAFLTKLIRSHKNLELEGVMSHLADSDGDDITTVNNAVSNFDQCVDAVRAAGGNPHILHVAQSAGSLRAVSKYANTMRLGIGLYGINPFPSAHELHKSLKNDLRPALRLVSTITKVTQLEKGDKVSYNYTYTAPHSMKIGVMPLGYYEGSWLLARGVGKATGEVQVGSSYAPIVGRVCMNHTLFSLQGIDARVGDQVVVYSNNPNDKNSIDAISQSHGLFNYAILTSLSSDTRRVATT
jgi:alanine racemase